MGHWRERAFREIRDELNRFLNFPNNQAIKLGDFGYFHSKYCDFEWIGNLEEYLGNPVPTAGRQGEIFETYATAGAVKIQFRLSATDKHVAGISFGRAHALAVRAFQLGLDRVHLLKLAHALGSAIDSGKLEWDVKRVIVTGVSTAEGFTHLVSGKSGAEIEIHSNVNAGGVPNAFNIADVNLGLTAHNSSFMAYETVAAPNSTPFFTLHKLRKNSLGNWALFRYGRERFWNDGIEVM
jgi:hypothetical protein